jgi:hypothetical protein
VRTTIRIRTFALAGRIHPRRHGFPLGGLVAGAGRAAIMCRPALAGLLVVALAASARATTKYVANNGVDGPACGAKTSPCRSISQAVNTIALDGHLRRTYHLGPIRIAWSATRPRT